MSYTQFPTPTDVMNDAHTVKDWVKWLRANNITHDFLPAASFACDLCGKPCGKRDDGVKWPLCYNCRAYVAYLDALVVGSYSFHAGLESLVGTYKDAYNGCPKDWKRLPLGAILWGIFHMHRQCIESALGDDPIFTWVPSDNTSRSFDHLEEIIRAVDGQFENDPWDGGVIKRNRAVTRPERNAVTPEAYEVVGEVQGRRVLLLDDLWTTGGSMVSAAAALKAAGAAYVVGVVLGRQVNPALSGHDELAKIVEPRDWRLNDCALCP